MFVENCSCTCSSIIYHYFILKSCPQRHHKSRLMKQQKISSLEQLLPGHQCIKLARSMAFASQQHKTSGQSGKKLIPLKTFLVVAIQRRQQNVQNVISSKSCLPSNGNPSARSQTKPSPKLARAPFKTFSHKKGTTTALQERSPTSHGLIKGQDWHGHRFARPMLHLGFGRRRFGQMSVTFTLETIEDEFLSPVALVKNFMTAAVSQSFPSPQCASWCGHAS
jgi:hypothetical protein